MRAKKNIYKLNKWNTALSSAIFFIFFIVILFLWEALKWPSLTTLLLSSNAAPWVQAVGGLCLILVTVIIFYFDRVERLRKDEQDHLNSVYEAKLFILNNGDYHSLILSLTSSLSVYGFNSSKDLDGKYDENYSEIYMLKSLLDNLRSLIGVHFLFINMSAPLGVPKMCVSFYFEMQKHIAQIRSLLEFRAEYINIVAGVRELTIVKNDPIESENLRDLQVEIRPFVRFIIDDVNALARLQDDLFKSLDLNY